MVSGLVSVRILGSKSDEKADMKKKPLKQYKVSSFFAGIGGFDLGLESGDGSCFPMRNQQILPEST